MTTNFLLTRLRRVYCVEVCVDLCRGLCTALCRAPCRGLCRALCRGLCRALCRGLCRRVEVGVELCVEVCVQPCVELCVGLCVEPCVEPCVECRALCRALFRALCRTRCSVSLTFDQTRTAQLYLGICWGSLIICLHEPQQDINLICIISFCSRWKMSIWARLGEFVYMNNISRSVTHDSADLISPHLQTHSPARPRNWNPDRPGAS